MNKDLNILYKLIIGSGLAALLKEILNFLLSLNNCIYTNIGHFMCLPSY